MHEQTPFLPPALELRAPDNIQEHLGDPTVAGWAMPELSEPAILINSGVFLNQGATQTESISNERSVINKISTRINMVRDGFSGLTEKQKLSLQLGVFAVLPAILPSAEILTNGNHKENAELFLQGYGLVGMYLMGAKATSNLRKLIKQSKV